MTVTYGNLELDHIWLARTPVPSASGLAWTLGLLEREFRPDGITVKAFWETDLNEAAHGCRDHERTTFREGGNIPALWMRSVEAQTRVIGLTWIDERQAIMVRPEHRLMALSDLKGMRIGLPCFEDVRALSVLRGSSLHGIESALSLAGLSFDDVELVDIPSPVVNFAEPETLRRAWCGLDLLAEGRLDAVYIKGAAPAELAMEMGLVVGIDLDSYPSRRTRINNGTPRPMIVHQHMIEEHFDIVVRFLRQVLEAADWAATHLPELKHILQRETFAGPEGVTAAYRNDFHRALHPNLSSERIAMLKTQEQFLRRSGFLDQGVDVEAWIDRRPLEAALNIMSSGQRDRGDVA